MTSDLPDPLRQELDALGERGLNAAARTASAMIAADIPGGGLQHIDPVPTVIPAEDWEELSAAISQRARLLDALYADLYGPRTVLASGIVPAPELFADPGYLRPAFGMPTRSSHHLFCLALDVVRGKDGSWSVVRDQVDVPGGAGLSLEMRHVLSRTTPALYRSTELRRLHPFFDAMRTALHARVRTEGRGGRAVVLTDDDPLRAFDHHWFANLLGWPTVAAGDLTLHEGLVRLQGAVGSTTETIDAIVRMVPSQMVDPLDLGPSPIGGVTGLLEAARRGAVDLLNPVGAGVLENPALRAALPDASRHLLHEDLRLRSHDGDLPAGASVLHLVAVATESGFEVMPGGIARHTEESGRELAGDIWVLAPEDSSVPESEGGSGVGDTERSAPLPVPPPTPMTRRIGADLFWFGRYLERVDGTARLVRAVVDTANDLESERSDTARTSLEVLLQAVTDVTSTYPGFTEIDARDGAAVRRELLGVVEDDHRPGTLRQSAAALEYTARNLRDVITDDVWPVLASLGGRLREISDHADEGEIGPALSDILRSCLTLSAAAEETMTRTIGFDLLQAGRRIERSLQLLSLLRSTSGVRRVRRVESRVTGALAAITETSAAYRRAYHAAMRTEFLLDLLLEDSSHPRTFAFQLEALQDVIERLPETTAGSQVRGHLADLRALASGWSTAELLTSEEGPTPLVAESTAAITCLRELSDAIETELLRVPERTSPWGFDDV